MARGRGIVDRGSPSECYADLAASERSLLIDVRTRAEWLFVGLPLLEAIRRELELVEWVVFPGMTPNAGFIDRMRAIVKGKRPERIFFICRSGQRSLMAAEATARLGGEMGVPIRCTNVTGGFEGDLDSEGRRGRLNGWKACGLPWRQG